jgi:S1-C subfamily serine protease
MCRVTLADQSTYDAKVVGFDQDKDVAVLRVDAPKEKLRPIPVGVSADLLVGQKVYAIANPVRFSYRFDAYSIVNVYSFMNLSICRVDGSPDLI